MRGMLLVLCLAPLAGSLQAGLLLNPEIVDGFYMQASGFSDFLGGVVDSAQNVSSNTSFLGDFVVAGSFPGVPGQTGGAGLFGSISDLSRGLVGSAVGGPAGSTNPSYFEGSDSILIVNLTFSGVGTATVSMHVTDSTVGISGPIGGAMLASGISAAGYHFANGAVDPNITFTGQNTGNNSCNGTFVGGICPDTLDGTPVDLSLALPINADRNQYQVAFTLSSRAAGAGEVNAANTGAISLSLSPGVNVDSSQGFLSLPQSPEPNYFGTSATVPEPRALSLVLALFFLLALVWRTL